MPSPKHLLGMS